MIKIKSIHFEASSSIIFRKSNIDYRLYILLENKIEQKVREKAHFRIRESIIGFLNE